MYCAGRGAGGGGRASVGSAVQRGWWRHKQQHRRPKHRHPDTPSTHHAHRTHCAHTWLRNVVPSSTPTRSLWVVLIAARGGLGCSLLDSPLDLLPLSLPRRPPPASTAAAAAAAAPAGAAAPCCESTSDSASSSAWLLLLLLLLLLVLLLLLSLLLLLQALVMGSPGCRRRRGAGGSAARQEAGERIWGGRDDARDSFQRDLRKRVSPCSASDSRTSTFLQRAKAVQRYGWFGIGIGGSAAAAAAAATRRRRDDKCRERRNCCNANLCHGLRAISSVRHSGLKQGRTHSAASPG